MSEPERAATAPSEPADIQSLRRVAFQAFAQDDEYYLTAWRHLLAGQSHYSGFNWSAALFGTMWCMFRKMYLVGISVYLLALVLAFVLGIIYGLFFSSLAWSEKQLTVVAVIAIILLVRIPLGFLANRLYFDKGSQAIGQTLERGLDGSAAIASIRAMGGVSVPALLIAMAAVLFARFAFGW